MLSFFRTPARRLSQPVRCAGIALRDCRCCRPCAMSSRRMDTFRSNRRLALDARLARIGRALPRARLYAGRAVDRDRDHRRADRAVVAGGAGRSRESARRTQCANNLHQMGVGLSGYHDARGYFPIGCLDAERAAGGLVDLLVAVHRRDTSPGICTTSSRSTTRPPTASRRRSSSRSISVPAPFGSPVPATGNTTGDVNGNGRYDPGDFMAHDRLRRHVRLGRTARSMPMGSCSTTRRSAAARSATAQPHYHRGRRQRPRNDAWMANGPTAKTFSTSDCRSTRCRTTRCGATIPAAQCAILRRFGAVPDRRTWI